MTKNYKIDVFISISNLKRAATKSLRLGVSIALSFVCYSFILEADAAASEPSAFLQNKSVVSLSATKAVPDAEAPWNVQNIDVSGFVGVVIGTDRILAPAALVSRAVFIQGQTFDDVNKIPLKVVFADYELNLAVLTPLEGRWPELKPVALGEDLKLNSDVSVVSVENDRQFSRVNLKILDVALRDVVAGGQQVLSYILNAQNRSACRGEPLMRQGKLVGLCMGFAENQPWAYTAGTLKHFIGDHLEADRYRGFPVLGIKLSSVRSPHLRKLLKWPDSVKGLQVVEVYENSAFAADLKRDDVLIGIDQFSLDNRGYISHPVWEAVPIRHYVTHKYSQDKITLKILRDGETKQFTQPVRRYSGLDNRIPGLTFDGEITHLIIGGLVFREVGVDYLTSFGRDWARYAPTNLLHMFYFLNKPVLARDRTIVMSHVLPDAYNQGYDKEAILVLTAVNGKPVKNIDELRLTSYARAEEHAGEKFIVFDFERGVRMVLPVKGLAEAHSRIAKSYAVSQQKSFLDAPPH